MARQRPPRGGRSRRDFLRLSSLAAAAAASGGVPGLLARQARASAAPEARASALPAAGAARGNAHPGRIVLAHDPALNGQGTIDPARVEAVVHRGVRVLTGIPETAAAFEALFPGLQESARIAIKVNCIGYTDTRWETVRGVVSGLALMLEGTYDVGRVTIFDNREFANRPGNPYRPSDFTFDGRCPLIDNSADDCSAYYAYDDHRLTTYLVEADHVINMPALKSHNRPYNQLTLALKNHYGSCCPSDLCDDIPGMLSLNADTHIRDKTRLVLMDGLRGTYDGPPQQAPQVWQTYAEGTPNTLFFSTDPVTNEYWGRETINAERLSRGMAPKAAPWVEEASAAPYSLGVSDEEAMTVLRLDPAGAPGGEEDPDGIRRGGAFLLSAVPNPCRDAALIHMRLPAPGRARLTILDAGGRPVRTLGERRFAGGPGSLAWDGRDDRGRAVPAGTYFARLESAQGRDVLRIVRAR